MGKNNNADNKQPETEGVLIPVDAMVRCEPLEQFLDYKLRPAIEVFNDPTPCPKLFATTTKRLKYNKTMYSKGTVVRVVMASRFGDVGITRDLSAENGYDFRVDPYDGTLIDYVANI